MRDITNKKITQLDFTSLLIFNELMRLRKATLVAEKMHVTQSAISHTLKRLRVIFEDELFLRKPHGFEPTVVALELDMPISKVIDDLREMLGEFQTFSPEDSTEQIRVGGFDYDLAVVIPPLLQRTLSIAPNMRISSVNVGRKHALEMLSNGDIDIAFSFFQEESREHIYDKLFEESYSVVSRVPIAKGATLSLDEYIKQKHIIVSPTGELSGIVDETLHEMGLARTVVASLPQFFTALATISESDFVATLPSRIATKYGKKLGLIVYDTPLAVRNFSVSAVRHRRNERKQSLNWIIEQCRQCM